jgi:hypothetical protein
MCSFLVLESQTNANHEHEHERLRAVSGFEFVVSRSQPDKRNPMPGTNCSRLDLLSSLQHYFFRIRIIREKRRAECRPMSKPRRERTQSNCEFSMLNV